MKNKGAVQNANFNLSNPTLKYFFSKEKDRNTTAKHYLVTYRLHDLKLFDFDSWRREDRCGHTQ
jgi:hypothetical protein